MTKALLIKVDGSVAETTFEGLKDLQKMVDGYIEAISLGSHVAYVNEEGKLRNMPINRRATKIVIDMMGTRNFSDYIVGNMVIVGEYENGLETDVSESLVQSILNDERIGSYTGT